MDGQCKQNVDAGREPLSVSSWKVCRTRVSRPEGRIPEFAHTICRQGLGFRPIPGCDPSSACSDFRWKTFLQARFRADQDHRRRCLFFLAVSPERCSRRPSIRLGHFPRFTLPSLPFKKFRKFRFGLDAQTRSQKNPSQRQVGAALLACFYLVFPYSTTPFLLSTRDGRLAQLVRATGLHPVGHRFESCAVHHSTF